MYFKRIPLTCLTIFEYICGPILKKYFYCLFVNVTNETSKSLNTLCKSRVYDMVIFYIKQFTNNNDKYVENIILKTSIK